MLTHLSIPSIPMLKGVKIGTGDSYKLEDVPTIKVNTLDMCYAHALLDRIFVWYWLIEDIKAQYPKFTHFNLLIGKDAVESFPECKRTINVKDKCYQGIWGDLSRLIPNTTILFEHLSGSFKFETLFMPPYEDQWQRTPWKCESYYPYRHVKFEQVRYSDVEFY